MPLAPASRARVAAIMRAALTYLLAAVMVAAGIAHFVNSEPFVGIVPKILPAPRMLVWISGFFEIAGGVGLAIPRFRQAAAWGLIALYLAVFPANINMAVNGLAFGDLPPDPVMAWARLPFQAVFIAWAWWVGRPPLAGLTRDGAEAPQESRATRA